jgi:hypothetical protein
MQPTGQAAYDRELSGIAANYHNTADPGSEEDSIARLRNKEAAGGHDQPSEDTKAGNTPGGGFMRPNTGKNKGSNVWGNGKGSKQGAMRFLVGLKGGRKKKFFIAGFAGSIGLLLIGLIVMVAILFSLFGSLKVVHFSTILRSAGFARFNLYMQDDYGRTIFDAATLTSNSTGTSGGELGDRSLLQKLLRVNPEARLTELGEEGTLKFDFQAGSSWGGLKKTNTFKGVEIAASDGTVSSIQLDTIAQQVAGKSFNDLGPIDRFKVRTEFIQQVNDAGLADRLALEGMSFRSSIYNGLRQLADIPMFTWLAGQQKSFAKDTEAEALKEEVIDDNNEVSNGTTTIDTGIDAIDGPAQEDAQDTLTAAEKGLSTTPTSVSMAKKVPLAKKLGVVDDVSNVALLATISCIGQSLDNSILQMGQQDQLKALRLGHAALTTGDQIKQGDNVNSEEVGAEADIYNNADTAVMYKEATGVPYVNAADQQQFSEVPNINGAGGALVSVVKIINDVLDAATVAGTGGLAGFFPNGPRKLNTAVCNIVLNQYAQYGLAGAELAISIFTAGTETEAAFALRAALTAAFEGGLQLGATIGIGELLGNFIDSAVQSAANLDYSATSNGPVGYDEKAVSVDYLQQTGIRQIDYGQPITAAQAASQQQEAENAQVAMNSQQSFTQRYFAISNPYSLLGQVAAILPTNYADVASYAREGLASVVNVFEPLHIFNAFSSLLVPPAFAASNQPILTGADKGVDEWGWPQWELNDLDYKPAYDWQANAAFVEPQYDQLNTTYSPCYNTTSDDQGDTTQIPAYCTAAFLSTPAAIHWRGYMWEAYSADHLAPGNADQ